MSVRRATPQDASAIAGLWNTVIRDTLITFNSVERSVSEIEGMIVGGPQKVFVAERHGVPFGFATYGQFRSGVGYARTMEHSIYLDPGARGLGLGRALMIEIERDATESGAHTLFAGVSSANPDGVAFHAALGFEHVATLKEVGFKWDQWLDLHLMQKRLFSPKDKS